MENRNARICVPVCVRSAAELSDAVKKAANVGDFIEIRFDRFDEDQLEAAMREYAKLRNTLACPVIVTFRPDEEGGYRVISLEARLKFWEGCGGLWRSDERFRADFADVEFTLLSDSAWQNQIGAERIICSDHDFEGIPKDSEELYASLAGTEPGVLKIAVQVADATECLPIFQLLERARRVRRDLVGIAMGQAGVMTRILGPSRGSFLTYGSLNEDTATAPGQLTARELREVYRIDKIDLETEVFGVIGRPIHHSISPFIHNAAFARADINAVFIPIEVNDLDSFFGRMVRENTRELGWNLRGLSVTAPHKTAVIKHLDWIDPAAKEIGAVNTIVVKDGALRGYNTDAIGFIGPLKQRIESLDGVQCAVIGAGGAARAVVWTLKNEQARVTVFARDCDRAKAITDDFGVDCRTVSGAAFGEFDLVVNATPQGTRGERESESPATAEQLRGVRLAYDLVYNPSETCFVREAREAGSETIGGLEMLIGQAVEQFKLWTGKQPDTETMEEAAIAALKV